MGADFDNGPLRQLRGDLRQIVEVASSRLDARLPESGRIEDMNINDYLAALTGWPEKIGDIAASDARGTQEIIVQLRDEFGAATLGQAYSALRAAQVPELEVVVWIQKYKLGTPGLLKAVLDGYPHLRGEIIQSLEARLADEDT